MPPSRKEQRKQKKSAKAQKGRSRTVEQEMHAIGSSVTSPNRRSRTQSDSRRSRPGSTSTRPPLASGMKTSLEIEHKQCQTTPGLPILQPSSLEPDTPPELRIFDFEIKSCIGKGTYGKVVAATEPRTGQLVALKVFDKDRVCRRNLFAGIMGEMNAYMRIIEHEPCPFINEADAAFQDATSLFIVMPHFVGDLQSQVGRSMRREYVQKHVLQIAAGLAALHRMGIVHRDIKPTNILLDSYGNVSITDFGMAYVHTEGPLNRGAAIFHTSVGTVEYVSPEILRCAGYGIMVDYWALGIVMCELLKGTTPFPSVSHLADYFNYAYDHTTYWKEEAGLNAAEAEVLAGLLNCNPASRLDFDGLRAYPYFGSRPRQDLLLSQVREISGPRTARMHFPRTLPTAPQRVFPFADISINYGRSFTVDSQDKRVPDGADFIEETFSKFNWINPRGLCANH